MPFPLETDTVPSLAFNSVVNNPQVFTSVLLWYQSHGELPLFMTKYLWELIMFILTNDSLDIHWELEAVKNLVSDLTTLPVSEFFLFYPPSDDYESDDSLELADLLYEEVDLDYQETDLDDEGWFSS